MLVVVINSQATMMLKINTIMNYIVQDHQLVGCIGQQALGHKSYSFHSSSSRKNLCIIHKEIGVFNSLITPVRPAHMYIYLSLTS